MSFQKIAEELHVELVILDDQDGFCHRHRGYPDLVAGVWRFRTDVTSRDPKFDKHMLMKGKSDTSQRLREKNRESNPEILAAQVLGCMANDSERLGRFLSLTGLTPNTLRQEAGTSQFLAAILEYVLADEPLLIAVAGELDTSPDAIAQAHRRLAPRAPDDP